MAEKMKSKVSKHSYVYLFFLISLLAILGFRISQNILYIQQITSGEGSIENVTIGKILRLEQDSGGTLPTAGTTAPPGVTTTTPPPTCSGKCTRAGYYTGYCVSNPSGFLSCSAGTTSDCLSPNYCCCIEDCTKLLCPECVKTSACEVVYSYYDKFTCPGIVHPNYPGQPYCTKGGLVQPVDLCTKKCGDLGILCGVPNPNCDPQYCSKTYKAYEACKNPPPPTTAPPPPPTTTTSTTTTTTTTTTIPICNNDKKCESFSGLYGDDYNENQIRCSSDCKTNVTIEPNVSVIPGQEVKLTIAFNDTRYQVNHNVKFDLIIDSQAWLADFCHISGKKWSELGWTGASNQVWTCSVGVCQGMHAGYSTIITSVNGYGKIETTCRIPTSAAAGSHNLAAIPTIY